MATTGTIITFMGSRYYAELYEKYHVDTCICAHSHIRMEMQAGGAVELVVAGDLEDLGADGLGEVVVEIQ